MQLNDSRISAAHREAIIRVYSDVSKAYSASVCSDRRGSGGWASSVTLNLKTDFPQNVETFNH